MVAILAFFFSAGLAWSLNSLAMSKWRKAAGRHWSERAALLYPARVSSLVNLALIPASFAAIAYLCGSPTPILVLASASFVGTVLGSYPMDREIMDNLGFGAWCHQLTARLFLDACLWVPFWVTAYRMPDAFGPRVWWTAALLAIFCLAVQYGLGLRLMRWLRLLRPASAELNLLVAEVSRTLAVPVRATWILERPSACACAYVVTRELGFSDRLLMNLNPEEIRSVTAHELAHLTEGRWVIAIRIARALWFLPLVFLRPMTHAFGLPGVIGLVLTLWLGRRAIGLLERTQEVRADQVAAAAILDPAVYAGALERLHELNLVPAVMPQRTKLPHPHLYDRMIAAGVTPDFPRPVPASGKYWTTFPLLALAALSAFYAVIVMENGRF